MSVYFVTARDVDLVKIGYAFNPLARYRHLRTSSPIELRLEGAIPGGFDKERELHKRYAKERMRGEWFRITPAIEAEIEASTKPAKYTWAAVRIWIRWLEEQETPQAAPEVVQRHAELRADFERRAHEAMLEKEIERGMSELERLERRGVIHFPFRAKEPA